MYIEKLNVDAIVIGCQGQIGSAIKTIFNCHGVDADTSLIGMKDRYKYMHVCIPYSAHFIHDVKQYKHMFKPEYIIIHSTVPVDTCTKLNVIHSPCRGIHPDLELGIRTFYKFLGGPDAYKVADYFRKHGLKVILCDKSETTELGKLLDTEYYRACIEFTQRAKNLCDLHEVPFGETFTLFNLTYNEGYKKLDHEEYCRPVLAPIMGEISGHCVRQNAKLLFDTLIREENQ